MSKLCAQCGATCYVLSERAFTSVVGCEGGFRELGWRRIGGGVRLGVGTSHGGRGGPQSSRQSRPCVHPSESLDRLEGHGPFKVEVLPP